MSSTTRYLLDTNVISELRKSRPHGAVVAWWRGLRDDQIFLPAVALGEIQRGIERARRTDPSKASEFERWADHLQESASVLPMDAACFRQWSRLMVGQPDSLIEDAMIAATAQVYGLELATRNTKDFAALGVKTFNPFRVHG